VGRLFLTVAAVALCAVGMQAQTAVAVSVSDSLAASTTQLMNAPLPNAPSSSLDGSTSEPAADASFAMPNGGAASPVSATAPVAGDHQKYITEGQQAPHLSVGDKFLLGLNAAFSLRAAAGWVGISLYEQALDKTPHYGQSFGGYGQRLGAAVARDSSEDVFSDSVLASVLHEDPRYYQMGPGHNVARRTIYAITRTLVTRKDDGSASVNFALLGGNLAGSVLTQAYYPPSSTGFGTTMATYGGSLAGSAFGYFVDEFLHRQLVSLLDHL